MKFLFALALLALPAQAQACATLEQYLTSIETNKGEVLSRTEYAGRHADLTIIYRITQGTSEFIALASFKTGCLIGKLGLDVLDKPETQPQVAPPQSPLVRPGAAHHI